MEKKEKDNLGGQQIEKDSQNKVDFLRYMQEVEKFPLEMESLQTSIESNRSTVRLADESITHFKETRSDSKSTLFATLGVSIITLIILIVQTFSTNETKIAQPISLNPEQVNKIIKAQEKNTIILSSRIDSMKLELKKLNKTVTLKNKKKSK